jgi:hypothetical protein
LWVASLGILVIYALPLLFAPLRWARRFGWSLPERTELVVYLGRCVGALAVAIVFVALRAAAGDPLAHPLLFELIAGACGILTVVHAKGALERAQPPSETAEIALYAALAAIALWIRLSM